MNAAAKTSAIACRDIPDETSVYFKEAAKALLAGPDDAEDIVARCLAAISRRAGKAITSRSLLTGEGGFTTLEMSNIEGRAVTPRDVMFTVGKLSRLSQESSEDSFEASVGKIHHNEAAGTAFFDMDVADARRLVEFSKGVSAGGAKFTLLDHLPVERDANFGRSDRPVRLGSGGSRNGSSYQGGRSSRGGGYGDSRGGGYGGSRGGYGEGRESRGGYGDRRGSGRDGGGDSRGGYSRRYTAPPTRGSSPGSREGW